MFIIIGLVLLLAASLVVYFTTREIVKPVEEEVIVPEDVRPVYDFVQGCVNEIAREGITLLGLQGGYIDLPAIIERTPTAYIPIDTLNYFKVPLWYYEGEDRTPSLGYMEREVSRHVNNELKKCTGDFEAFEGRFKIAEEGNVTTRTVIAEDSVIIRIKWPLALTTFDRTTRIEDYIVRMPVRLKQMWALANTTMTFENQNSVFEKFTIDLMAADREHIPLDGLEVECGVKRWYLNEIQDRLERILYYNIPTTRIKNTDYFPFLESTRTYETLGREAERITKELEAGKDLIPPKIKAPRDAYQYFKNFYDVGVRPSNLKVGFEYHPEWGMRLNAQPNEGPLLKSNTGRGPGRFLRYMCINQWHFAYDVIYYVKMSVRDDEAFGGEGYNFQFAFPVLINDNAPERVFFGLKKFQSVDFGAPEFCLKAGDQLVDIRAVGQVEDMPILMELPDAQINYKCFNQECELGKTVAEGGIYRLSTYLPQSCTNPLITASKEGYLSETEQMTTDTLTLQLKKLEDYNLKFVVHPYHGQSKTWGASRELRDREEVSMSISMVNKTYDQFISWPVLEEKVGLVQETAHYNIDAILSLNENQIGGYNAQVLKIPFEDLAGKDTIVINLVEYLPVSITDKQKANMIIYLLEGDYRDDLAPEFE